MKMKDKRYNPAQELNDLFARVSKAERDTLDLQLELGKKLIEEKARYKHGEWEPWIKANCIFSANQARRYMCIYRELNPEVKSTVTVDFSRYGFSKSDVI